MQPKTVIFIANSPGEIAGWLAPLVHEVRRRWPQSRLVLQLLLCEFASGQEKRIGQDILGLEEIRTPAQYWRTLLTDLKRYPQPIIIHLGGDMMYSALLAWRWKVPLWIYVWGRKWLDPQFSGYLVRNEYERQKLLEKGLAQEKIAVVGDLVVDATAFTLARQQKHLQETGATTLTEGIEPTEATKPTEPNQSLSSAADAPIISFLPGSRTRELCHLAPHFLKVAQIIKQQIPQSRFQLIVSPFIAKHELPSLLATPPLAEIEGISGTFTAGYMRALDNSVAMRVIQEDHLAHLAHSSLAVTIPGTKTSELSCLGVPMICCLPINRPDMLPITGIIGWLDFLPRLGPWLKKTLVLKFATRSRFYALPNLLAQKCLVPELVGVLTAQQVADAALNLWRDSEARQAQRQALKELYEPSRGAAERFFAVIEAY